MIKLAFSVYDNKAMTYSNPFYSLNIPTAIRDFTSACRDVSLDLHKYPEDFTLQYLGTFDDANGKLISLQNPEPIITALACQENYKEFPL